MDIFKEDLGVEDQQTVAGRCAGAIIYGKSFCGLRVINKYKQKKNIYNFIKFNTLVAVLM
jgi:hypothetical protein